MKKREKTLIFSLIVSLSSPLFGGDIFTDEEIKNLQNQSNLDHLFNNSKFPVDDYIYKAGKKEPKQDGASMVEVIKKLDEFEEKTKPNEQTSSPEDTLKEQENLKQKAIEKQKVLKTQQIELKNEIQMDNQRAYEYKMKKLIRAQILSDRGSEISSINQSSKFGVDGFSNQKSIDISTNEHRLYRTIRAGRMIPAILTTAISSDLNGVVTAQIEQDIYATMGKAVLIPRGSKAIGFYTNDTEIGHERLEIMWREIITPQGINIMLTDAIVADNMGMNGAVGAVNNKYWERYGIAYSISTVTNALLLTIASKMKNSNQYATEVYSNAKSDISSVVQDIIQQQSQIKPTIEIQSGSRIFLVPTNHMWFAKPKNGEVLMQYFND
ncbi:DNA type IV secretion system protein ComB10 [Campylobacter ureolyticus]|uniref:DNA type IV secretion system protein ComB10 n=1 Tax=Campylobacter ureolyticus TaxID=827 RepID=UPI0022B41899|nr:DNA type IV secretion system protein ComB10 [Campylobacter ureolyticus]MCZ6156594.1 DNA type IV secretion system protein ComB10 [Campylobacter ureolyticus]